MPADFESAEPKIADQIPGFHVEEISVFPPTVTQVETAIPAFIRYSEIAKRDVDNDLHLKLTKIESMQGYVRYFGGPQVVSAA